MRVTGDAIAVHSSDAAKDPDIFVFPPSSVVPPSATPNELSRTVAHPAVQAALQGVSASVLVLGAAGNDACARATTFAHLDGAAADGSSAAETGVVPSALQALFAGLEAKAASAARLGGGVHAASAPSSRHGTPRAEQSVRPSTAAAGGGAGGPSYSCDVFMQVVDFVGAEAVDLLATAAGPVNSQPVSMKDIAAFTAGLPQIDTHRTSNGGVGMTGRSHSAVTRSSVAGAAAAGGVGGNSAPPTHRAGSQERSSPHVVLDVEDGAFVSGARVVGPLVGPSEAMGAIQEALHTRRAARSQCDAQWRKHGVEQYRKVVKGGAGGASKPSKLFTTLRHDDLFTPPSAAAITVVKIAVEQVFRVPESSRPSTAQSTSSATHEVDSSTGTSTHELRSVLWLVDVSGMQWLAAARAGGTQSGTDDAGGPEQRAKSAMGGSSVGTVALPPLTGIGGGAASQPRATSARAHRDADTQLHSARSSGGGQSLLPPPPLQFETGLPAAQGLAALFNTLSALSHRDTVDTAGEVRRSHAVTRLLEDALGMNAVLVAVGVVGRGDECSTASATLSLCDHITRVRSCPVVNSDPARALVKAYRVQLRHARLALQSAHSLLKRAAKRVRASTRTARAAGVPEEEVRSRVASAVAEAETRAQQEAAAAAAAVAELEALRRAQERNEGPLDGDLGGDGGDGGELSTARYRSERDKLLARLRDAYDRCASMADDKEQTLNLLIESEEEKLALQQGLVQFQVWGDTLSGQLAAAGLAAAPMPGAQEATVAFHTQGGARGVSTLSGAAVQDEVARMRSQLGTLQEALTKTKRELQAERLRRASSVAELEHVLSGGGAGEYADVGQAVLQHARNSEQLQRKLRAAEETLAAQGGRDCDSPALQAISELRAELRALKGGAGGEQGQAGGVPPGNIPPWLWYSPPWAWGGGAGGPAGPGGVPPPPRHGSSTPDRAIEGGLGGHERSELQRLRAASAQWDSDRRTLQRDLEDARSHARQLQAETSRLAAELADAQRMAAVPQVPVAPVSPPTADHAAAPPPSAGAGKGGGASDSEALQRAKRAITELKAQVTELQGRLQVAEEEAKKLRALPERLSVEAPESTMLGQLQRSEKNGVELQTKVIMLQAELANASRQVKLLLSRAGSKKRR